jgi:hypothetical protein
MIRLDAWILAVASGMGILWYECGEDFVLFCYRIGCGAIASASSRALEFAPVQAVVGTTSRNNVACSNRSFTSSARFTTPKV